MVRPPQRWGEPKREMGKEENTGGEEEEKGETGRRETEYVLIRKEINRQIEEANQ